jgi:hypothetical protein
MSAANRRPVRRIRVLGGAVCLLALLATVVVTGELLRHPHRAIDVAEEQLAGADPRDEVTCGAPLPREGQRRAPSGEPPTTVEVSSNNLYDCPQSYDGRRVQYRGEVVGALLRRDIGVWVQLNDDVYSELLGPLPSHREFRGGNAGVGVLLPAELAARITAIGGPRSRGDIVEVEGTFNRVDPSGEVAVIRADAGRVTSAGGPNTDPPLTDRRIVAILAVIAASAVVVAERLVARQR